MESARVRKEGNGHGRGHAFAADIADDRQNPAALGRDDLEKVPTHFVRRFVDRFDLEAGNGRRLCRDEHLLHGPSRLPLRRRTRLLVAHAIEAQENHNADGEEVKQISWIVDADEEWPDRYGTEDGCEARRPEPHANQAQINKANGKQREQARHEEPASLAIAAAVPQEEQHRQDERRRNQESGLDRLIRIEIERPEPQTRQERNDRQENDSLVDAPGSRNRLPGKGEGELDLRDGRKIDCRQGD